MDSARLSMLDYVCLAGMIVLSSSLGLVISKLTSRGQRVKDSTAGDQRAKDSTSRGQDSKGMTEFALAGGNMAVLPVAFSLSATVLAGSTMVGATGEVYLFSGTEYLFFGLGAMLGLFISGALVVPVYRNISYVSVYEYLERRYDRSLRTIFSAVYIISKTMFNSVVLYVPALALTTLTPIPQWVSVLVSGAVCIAYCVIGGMKAVIWADVLQAVLMVTCNVLLIAFGLHSSGGIARAGQRAMDVGRIGHFAWLEDERSRYSVWSLTLGAMVIFMNAMCAGQAGIQRVLSVKTMKEAKRATYIGGVMVLFFMTQIVLVGLVLSSHYANCDPILRRNVTGVRTHDQILVFAIGDLLGGVPGLRGLALAGIFSGSLSTFSSYINSFATLTVQDFIPESLTLGLDSRKLLLCRLFTLVYGGLSIVLAFLVPYLGGIVKTTVTISGATGGPLTAVILLGMFSRKATKKGVMTGLVVGLSLTLWMSTGSMIQKDRVPLRRLSQSLDGCSGPDKGFHFSPGNQTFKTEQNDPLASLYNVSFMWYGPIGLVSALIVGYIFSLIFRDKHEKYDERLFYHLTKRPNMEEPSQEHNLKLLLLSSTSAI